MYEIFKLRSVKYYVEPNGSYAVAAAGTGSYLPIKVLEDSAALEVNVEMVENKTMMQRIDDVQPKINTRKRCNFSFTSYLNGTGVSASNGVAAVTSAIGDMLTTVMGGGIPGAGSKVTSISSQGMVVLEDQGFNYNFAGGALGFIDPNTNAYETTRLSQVTNRGVGGYTTCSFVHNLGFVPASGSTVYGAASYYLTQDPDKSLQFFVHGQNTYDTWVAAGLNGGFTLKIELGQLPEIAFKMENGATWFYGTQGTLLPETYTDATPPPFVDGYVRFGARGVGGGTAAPASIINVDTIEITPAIAYVDVTTERGINNILRKRRNRVTPVATGKLVTYLENLDLFTARDNSTMYFCEVQVGTVPGNTVMISMPRVKITNTQVIATSTGLTGVEVTFDILEDTLSTNESPTDVSVTDLVRSAFSVHLL